jgi:hypothetical protein
MSLRWGNNLSPTAASHQITAIFVPAKPRRFRRVEKALRDMFPTAIADGDNAAIRSFMSGIGEQCARSPVDRRLSNRRQELPIVP